MAHIDGTQEVRTKIFYEELSPAIGVSQTIRLIRIDDAGGAIYGPDNSPARTEFSLTSDRDGISSIHLVPNARFEVETVYEYTITESGTGTSRTSRFIMPDTLPEEAALPDDDPNKRDYYWMDFLLKGFNEPVTITFERGWTTSPDAPLNPVVGQGWLNSTTRVLSYWDGSQWVPLAGHLDIPDQLTAEQVRALVESANNSNVFTDLLKTKLEGIQDEATVDQTGSEIVDAINTTLGSTAWQSSGGGGTGPVDPVDPGTPATAYFYSGGADDVLTALTSIPASAMNRELNTRSYTEDISIMVPAGGRYVLLIPSNVLPRSIFENRFNVLSAYDTGTTVLIDGITYGIYSRVNSGGRELPYNLELIR